MTIRVLIADDQELLRAGFRKLLDTEDAITVVGEAADGAEAVALATQLAPDRPRHAMVSAHRYHRPPRRRQDDGAGTVGGRRTRRGGLGQR
jgi:hypothetical protein